MIFLILKCRIMVSTGLAKLNVSSSLTIAFFLCDSSNGRTPVLHTGGMVQFPFTAIIQKVKKTLIKKKKKITLNLKNIAKGKAVVF